jgi:DnaJ-class molecular chaperone
MTYDRHCLLLGSGKEEKKNAQKTHTQKRRRKSATITMHVQIGIKRQKMIYSSFEKIMGASVDE